MRFQKLFPVCLIVGFIGCGKKQETLPEAPYVAKVGEVRISPEEFAREMGKRGANFTEEQRETVLQGMIRTEALLAKAKAEGFDRDPEIAARVKRLIASAYEEKLKGPEVGRTNSPAELEEFYAQHAAEFVAPERVRAAMILWRVPKKAIEEKQKEYHERAEKILREARQLPADVKGLGDLARMNSEDQATRYLGGDLGWMTRAEAEKRFGAELAGKVFALKNEGEVSGVWGGPDGLYLFKLIGHEEPRRKTLEEVKPLLIYRLSREKEAMEQKAIEEKIRSGSEIKIDRAAVERAAPIEKKSLQAPQALEN